MYRRRSKALWAVLIGAIVLVGLAIPLWVTADSGEPALTATLYSDVIRFEADGVASLRLTIYDLSENELWTSGLIPGDFADWDRTNAVGERLANGYYLYLAQGWDGSDRLVLNKAGKVVLLPGDQVELKAAPAFDAPVGGSRDEEPIVVGTMAVTTLATLANGNVIARDAGTSDVGFQLDTGAFNWIFRTYTSNGGFTASKAGTGGTEVLFGTSGGDFRNAYVQIGDVTKIANSGDSYFAGGDVGVGTTNVTDTLTIQGSSGNLIACYPGGSRAAGAAVFRVESDGDVYADGTVYSAATAVGSADVAERINASEWVEAGDVVEIDPEHVGYFRKASGAYSRRVAGIISTSPGVILGNDIDPASDEWNDNRPVLAIVGRVPVKVSTENGPIAVGDLLVSSSISGVAMKGDPAVSIGAVVGKAMEALESGEGVIMAQVTLR